MKLMTNHKIIFIFFGFLSIAHGFLFFLGGPGLITMDFPDITVTQEINKLFQYSMEITSVFNWMLGILLLCCSRLNFPEVRIVLIGLGIGLFSAIPITVLHSFQAFNPGAVILSIFSIWTIHAGLRGHKFHQKTIFSNANKN